MFKILRSRTNIRKPANVSPSVERIEYDYGYDLLIFTYDAEGEIENGQIYIQLKATDSLSTLADQKTISFTLTRSVDKDLEVASRICREKHPGKIHHAFRINETGVCGTI